MNFYPNSLRIHFVPLLIVTTLTVVFSFLIFGSEKAQGSYYIPAKSMYLADSHDAPEGIWSDGTTVWVTSADQDKVLAYSLANHTRSPGKDIELASYNGKPRGIWSDGTIMWVADWDDTKLYAYGLSNGARREQRDIDLTGSNDGPRGIWGTGTLIYVVDKDDTYVYAYRKSDGQRQNSEEFDLDGDNERPWGIWGDDSTVWVSDIYDEMLYAYTTLTNSFSNAVRDEASELAVPPYGDEPRGIWSDGETMWVVEESTTALYAMFLHNFRRVSDDIGISRVNTPRGSWTNGSTVWVVEAGSAGSQKLFAYNANTGLRQAGKDIRLDASSGNPVAVWSDGETIWVVDDGSSNDFLLAHELDQESTDTQLLVPNKSITLHSDNAAPSGVWSDGQTAWVSDSDDAKVYAYDLDAGTREPDGDFDLLDTNEDPRALWSDGETLWVLDSERKFVFSYPFGPWDISLVHRGFRLNPANGDPTGLTGYGKRLWVTDEEDEKLYAYTKINSPATFRETSARFNIHYALEGNEYVGTVPDVIDIEGDTLTYSLTGRDSGRFTIDQSGNIYTAAGATDFTGGDNYSMTASVSDGKTGLDSSDDGIDDSINVRVHVFHNADPVFVTPDGMAFNVAEDVTESETIAEIDVSDPDEDSLEEAVTGDQALPFAFDGGEIKLKSGESLDYELRDSYEVTLTISDLKDEDGDTDSSVDDEIRITINVTNVDEDGEITLNSSQPEVDKAIVATLSDPDGVDLSNGRKINWVLSRNSDPNTNNWTEISDTETTSTSFEYTPVTADVGTYLQFKATYRDNQDSTQDRTEFSNTDNTVLAQPPVNGAPTFDEGATATRTLPEDAANLHNIGDPVSATDPDEDELTYILNGRSAAPFKISNDGQLQVTSKDTCWTTRKSLLIAFRSWSVTERTPTATRIQSKTQRSS